jgi:hypothetical protein
MVEISIEYLRECFDYDRDTGTLTWRVRPREHFPTADAHAQINAKLAGKTAGYVGPDRYVSVRVCRKLLKAHRVVFAVCHGRWPYHTIDHINGDPLGNRLENLRDVEQSHNLVNRRVSKNSASGEMNIGFVKSDRLKPWHVQIIRHGVKYQKHFALKEEAVTWRDAKHIELGFHPNHGKRPSQKRVATHPVSPVAQKENT